MYDAEKMMKKYRVTETHMICYGTSNKAWIVLNKGQIWQVAGRPMIPDFPYWTVKRNNITLDIWPGDFNRHFEEVTDEDSRKVHDP